MRTWGDWKEHDSWIGFVGKETKGPLSLGGKNIGEVGAGGFGQSGEWGGYLNAGVIGGGGYFSTCH